jgi:hypothetical protein
LIGCTALGLHGQGAWAQDEPQEQPKEQIQVEVREEVKRADFGEEAASPAAHQVADWVVTSGDSKTLPFVIIDKVAAKVYVFEPEGRLRGAAPALLGIAKGDHTAPGIANLPLGRIKLSDRTTPAGRFEASLGMNASGKDILWVDYDSALSLHRVVTGNAKERRAQRLATSTVADNRISFGCINVPVPFYEKVVSPAFKGTTGIVYVLPEVRPLKEVFSALQ